VTHRLLFRGWAPVFVLLLAAEIGLVGQDAGRRTSFTLQSAVLNEQRSFEIHVPSGSGPFDVVYVLDGQVQFGNVVNALAQVDRSQTIVVGLGNIWLRDRDYTPTRVGPSSFVDATAAAVSGGGERFIAHVEQELIPYVNTHYPASGSRTLVGHSLGGLIAVEILLKHPLLFQRFVVIDPSLWWDGATLVTQSADRLKGEFGNTRLFVGIGAAKNKDRNDVDAVRRDASDDSALIRPTVLFVDAAKAASGHGLRLDWKYYPNQDHMSVFQPAAIDGLRFVMN
jgi:predicted alpha/beta superfamily hydrolase